MGIVARQGIKTGIILYIGVLIGALNNVWFFPKFLAPEEIGILRLLLSNEAVLFTLVQLGTNGIIDRFFPVFKGNPKKRGALVQFTLLYPLLGLGVFLSIYFLFPDLWQSFYAQKSPGVIKYYGVLALLVFLYTYQLILVAFCRAYYRIVVPNILDNFLLKGAIAVMAVLLGFNIMTFSQFIWGLVFIRFINIGVLIAYLKQLVKEPVLWGNQLAKDELKEVTQYGFYMILGSASSVIISQVDVMMLASIIGERETGIYTIAFFMGAVVEMPRRALSQISVPVISSAWKDNDLATIKQIYQKTSINQLIVGAWVLGLILLNVQDIFAIMPKGKIYQQGIYVVVLIGLTRFLDMAMGANNEILLYSKYYRFNLLTNVILAVIMVGINAILIPMYQLTGAAFATLLSLIIFNLIRFTFLFVKYKIQPFTQKTLLALLLIGATTLLAYFTSKIHLSPLINIVVKSIIISLFFAAGVWGLKLSEDINQLIKKVTGIIKRKS